MSDFLGIDHPLVLFRDLDGGAEQYALIGFAPRPLGRHPWGTSMRLVQMEGSSIELMGVYDESLIDEHAVGSFRFGRYIRDQLQERQGISMLALHSDDAEGDAAQVQQRGIACEGTVNFGRPVTLEDGRADRTKTTLKILLDPTLPRLVNFIVHQHRPELVFRPEWQVHPNGATAICQVTIMAERVDWPIVRTRLIGLYGESEVFETMDGFGVQTGNGVFRVMDQAAVRSTYGNLPPELASEHRPSCVAIHVNVPELERVRPFLNEAKASYEILDGEIRLTEAERFGNVFLSFVAKPMSQCRQVAEHCQP